MLEYKIERDSTTTTNCVFDLTSSEKEWWINKLSYFQLTKELENKLIKRWCNVIDFVFECGNRTNICISKNNVVYWEKNSKNDLPFSKSILKTSLKHLMQNCYFMVGNSILKQKIGIPLWIDPAPFWVNLFLYTYEKEYMSERISNIK